MCSMINFITYMINFITLVSYILKISFVFMLSALRIKSETILVILYLEGTFYG